MATETEQLVVQLEARINQFDKDFRKANRIADKNWTDIERRGDKAAKNVERSFGGMGEKLSSGFALMGRGLGLAGLTAGGIFAGVQKAVGDLAQISADAKKAGIGAEAFQEMTYAARQAQIPVDSLTDGLKELQLRADEFVFTGKGSAAEAFGRIGMNPSEVKERLKDPAAMLEEIIRRLGRLDKASQIRILDELFGGQAGENFVRFLDAGIGSIAQLRQEARETGNVLSEDILRDAESIDREFKKVADTVGTQLRWAVVTVARGLKGFLKDLERVKELASDPEPENVGRRIVEITAEQIELEKRLADAKNRAAESGSASDTTDAYVIEERLKRLREEEQRLKEAGWKQLDNLKPTPAEPPLPPLPPPPPPGGTTKDKVDKVKKSYADLQAAMNGYIASQRIELATVRMAEPAAEAYRIEQELLNRAQAEGITLTDSQKRDLATLASQYRDLVMATEGARIAQEQLADRQAEAAAKVEDFKASAQNVLGGFISDLRAGISWTEALSSALANIADQLLEISLNALFKSQAADGVVGAIIGGLGFADGGYVRGPGSSRSDSIPARVSNGEFIVNAKATAQNRGLLEAVNAGRMPSIINAAPALPAIAGNTSNMVLAPTINVSVAGIDRGDKAADQDLATAIGKQVDVSLRQLVAQELRRQMRPRGVLNME